MSVEIHLEYKAMEKLTLVNFRNPTSKTRAFVGRSILPATQRRHLPKDTRNYVSLIIIWRSGEPRKLITIQRLAKCHRQIPYTRPRSSLQNPSVPIFPSLATGVPHRLTLSMENLDEPWFGGLQLNSSTTLLQKRRKQDNPKKLLFEAIYEGLTDDPYRELNVYPIHPINIGVGHN
jgi:hypothetical protein